VLPGGRHGSALRNETETEEHVARLVKVFEEIDETARGKTCDVTLGISEEGQDVMKEFKGAPTLDASLLATAVVRDAEDAEEKKLTHRLLTVRFPP
jgi:ferritin-like metal-binding protein YciE